MSGKPQSRRAFLRQSSIFSAGAVMAPRIWALGQDAVVDADKAANRTGYEKIAWKAMPFPMNQVRLRSGLLKEMQERDRMYLYMMPNDRLLHSFRVTAGKPTSALPLGGWEAPDCELRGHHAGGHYLSACALMYASTGDESLRLKAEQLVQALAECQQKNGYLSAYPESTYNKLKYHDRVWAPFYTYHKIMAGHLDMYVHCGSETALQTATRMGDWAIEWIAPLSDEELAKIQMVEHGGMNEVLFNLYAVTGEKKYLDAGYRFEHKRFFDPLAARQDKLAGLHSNTNIPKVIGAARGYELTGDERYKGIAEYFFETIADHHSFAPGGTSNNNEGWSEPDTIGTHLAPGGQECCCSYNMLKLSRHLFGWQPNARLMDYYEHLLWNVRAGTQNSDGMLMYYVATVPGGWKTFGDAYDSNWCCTGTGCEEYAKLTDTIYFHDEDSVYVNHFVSSELRWPGKHLRLVQETNFPEEQQTTLTVYAEGAVNVGLRIRAPHWAEGIKVSVNGHLEKTSIGPDGYILLNRNWKSGDRIEVTLPMKLRQEAVAGSSNLASVSYGPLTLAARLGREGLSQDMIDNNQGPDTERLQPLPMPEFTAPRDGFWVTRVENETLAFHTVGQSQTLQLEPLYQILDERYSVYFKQLGKA